MAPGKGFVIPAGDGRHLDMGAPGRFAALKLLGHETGESVMLFEEMLKRSGAAMSDHDREELRERYRWEIVGPNPP